MAYQFHLTPFYISNVVITVSSSRSEKATNASQSHKSNLASSRLSFHTYIQSIHQAHIDVTPAFPAGNLTVRSSGATGIQTTSKRSLRRQWICTREGSQPPPLDFPACCWRNICRFKDGLDGLRLQRAPEMLRLQHDLTCHLAQTSSHPSGQGV